MSRFWVPALALGAVATVVCAARAAAPPEQYQAFDTTSTQICDRQTGLLWQRRVSGEERNFDAAQRTCAAPLRLPTVKELLSLVDEDRHLAQRGSQEVLVAADRAAFSELPTAPVWTSTGNAPDAPNGLSDRRFVVNFASGEATLLRPEDNAFVLCVRAATQDTCEPR